MSLSVSDLATVVHRDGRLWADRAGLGLLAVVAAAAVALLPITVSGVLLCGGILAVATIIRPMFGLVVLAVVVPFASLMEIPLGGVAVTAIEPLTIAVAGGWFARLVVQRQRLSAPVWPALPVALFLAIICFELTLIPDPALGIKEALRWGELLLVAVVGGDLLRQQRQMVMLVVAILGAGIVEALVGWGQFALRAGPPAFAIGPFVRAHGTFGQPNPFAGYLGMVWPLALSLAVAALLGSPLRGGQHGAPMAMRATLRKWIDLTHSLLSRRRLVARSMASRHHAAVVSSGPLGLGVLGLVASSIIGIAMLMSMSRGAWLGMLLAALVVLGFFRRRIFTYVVPAAGLGVALLLLGQFDLLPTSISTRLSDAVAYFRVFDARDVSASAENWAIVERMASWQAAWGMFEAAPIVGVGPGHYDAAYPRFRLPKWPQPLGHAHNYYLNVLAEMGAIGLASYLLLLAGWFWNGISLLRRLATSSPPGGLTLQRSLVVGVVAALGAVAVHNFFDNLYVRGMNVQVGLLLALMFAVSRDRRPHRPSFERQSELANPSGGRLPSNTMI